MVGIIWRGNICKTGSGTSQDKTFLRDAELVLRLNTIFPGRPYISQNSIICIRLIIINWSDSVGLKEHAQTQYDLILCRSRHILNDQSATAKYYTDTDIKRWPRA